MGRDKMTEKKRNLSKEKILSTTLAMLENTQHKNDISMRELSKVLDVQASAIYWYYKNKNELIQDAAETVFSQLNDQTELRASKQNLIELALLYYRILSKYPFIIEVMTTTDYSMGPEHLKTVSNFQTILINLGVSEAAAYTEMINFHSYLIGSLYSAEIESSISNAFAKKQLITHKNSSREALFIQGVELWQKGLLEK